MFVDFITENQIKNKEKALNKSLEVLKLVNEFLTEISQNGHKKITTDIIDIAQNFLDKKHIKCNKIIFQNYDIKPNNNQPLLYYDRTLTLNIQDYYGSYDNITLLQGLENDAVRWLL